MPCNNKSLKIPRKKLTPAWQGNGAIFVSRQRHRLLIHLRWYESQIFNIELSLYISIFMSLISFRTLTEMLPGQTKSGFPSKGFSWPIKVVRGFLKWLRGLSMHRLLENSSFKTGCWIDLAYCMRKITFFDCAILKRWVVGSMLAQAVTLSRQTTTKVNILEGYKGKERSFGTSPPLCSVSRSSHRW